MCAFGLIGKNISYSYSARWFADQFKERHLPYTYLNYDVENVAALETLLKTTEVLGFNVTIPYKSAIIPLLAAIDSEAASIGAVNTICKTDVGWKGYNTDIYGFRIALEKEMPQLPAAALIIGRGGAAKAAQHVLKHMGIRCFMSSRLVLSSALELPADLSDFTLWINATPVGTSGLKPNALPLPWDKITSQHILFDMVYNPAITPFMEMGKKRGATVCNGLAMLEEQARKSFELWMSFIK